MTQVTLIHKDGSQVRAHPVDVAELLRGGEYRLAPGETYEPPLESIADLVRSGRYKLVPVDGAPEAVGSMQNHAAYNPTTHREDPASRPGDVVVTKPVMQVSDDVTPVRNPGPTPLPQPMPEPTQGPESGGKAAGDKPETTPESGRRR